MKQIIDVVVFFLPEVEIVNGGVLSIYSLAAETRHILGEDARVYLSVSPHKKSYHKNVLFDNNEVIHEFNDIIIGLESHKNILLQIPEYMTTAICDALWDYKEILAVHDVRINILNQNIELMPPPSDVGKLFTYSSAITQSTAHLKYTNQLVCNNYGIPLHHMSVCIDESAYITQPFSKKNNVILYSNDDSEHKSGIIEALSRNFSNFKIIEINNMKYEQYKEAISVAKYVVTFGEGMDGYLIESTYSNTVAFAVYNETFFPTKDFANLANIFKSYEDMLQGIVSAIKNTEKDARVYDTTCKKTRDLLLAYYSKTIYRRKVEKFYEFDNFIMPENKSIYTLLRQTALAYEHANYSSLSKIAQLTERSAALQANYEERIKTLADAVEISNQEILSIQDSISWRLTRPLRALRTLINRRR